MTVTSTVRDVTYGGPGAGPFPVPFFVFTPSSDLVLTQTDAGVAPYTLAYGPAWTVSGTGSNVSVSLATALPSTSTLQIQRVVGFVQDTSFTNQGPYLPSAIEAALDLLTMQTQQLNAGIQYLAPLVATLQAAQANVTTLQDDITALQNRATADEATAASLAANVTTLGTQANANTAAVQTNSSSISSLLAQMAAVVSAAQITSSNVASVATRLTAAEANIAALTTRVGAVEITAAQNATALLRAILAPSGDTTLGTLPDATTRANNLLGFGTSGQLALYAQDAPGA